MKMFVLLAGTLLWCTSFSIVSAQGISASATPNQLIAGDMEVVERDHTITANGNNLNYKSTAGFMNMTNEGGEPKAKFYFTAYTLNNVARARDRPITFVFNGGPGSAPCGFIWEDWGPV